MASFMSNLLNLTIVGVIAVGGYLYFKESKPTVKRNSTVTQPITSQVPDSRPMALSNPCKFAESHQHCYEIIHRRK